MNVRKPLSMVCLFALTLGALFVALLPGHAADVGKPVLTVLKITGEAKLAADGTVLVIGDLLSVGDELTLATATTLELMTLADPHPVKVAGQGNAVVAEGGKIEARSGAKLEISSGTHLQMAQGAVLVGNDAQQFMGAITTSRASGGTTDDGAGHGSQKESGYRSRTPEQRGAAPITNKIQKRLDGNDKEEGLRQSTDPAKSTTGGSAFDESDGKEKDAAGGALIVLEAPSPVVQEAASDLVTPQEPHSSSPPAPSPSDNIQSLGGPQPAPMVVKLALPTDLIVKAGWQGMHPTDQSEQHPLQYADGRPASWTLYRLTTTAPIDKLGFEVQGKSGSVHLYKVTALTANRDAAEAWRLQAAEHLPQAALVWLEIANAGRGNARAVTVAMVHLARVRALIAAQLE